jgi:predicted dehydrogenase
MKFVIIGYGSIAKKHLSALNYLGLNPKVYLLRNKLNSNPIDGYENIYNYSEIPEDIDFIIISNPTYLHKDALIKTIPLGKPIFLEKPPFQSVEEYQELKPLIDKFCPVIYTAFNLRFHPVIKWLKNNVNPNEIIEMQAYCGSYLPLWRPDTDYRDNYSSKKDLGGGVHLDLIHELDYIIYLIGFPENASKFFSKKSSLEIDSVDCAHYWLEYKQCNVSIILNYYRKFPKRTLEIVIQNDIYEADLISGIIKNGDGKIVFQSKEQGIMHTYIKQMEHFLKLLDKQEESINSFDSALKTLSLCI